VVPHKVEQVGSRQLVEAAMEKLSLERCPGYAERRL
jgi:hypothetical protein